MRKIQWFSLFLACWVLLGGIAAAEETSFTYEHDPRDNPNAMKDIVENPFAVYGFSPNPDSVRLGNYADLIDWTDPEQVAAARAQRQGLNSTDIFPSFAHEYAYRMRYTMPSVHA